MNKLLCLTCAAAIVFGLASSAHGRNTSALDLSPEGEAAYSSLVQAKRFEDRAIGEGGTRPNLVKAYQVLIRERAAAAAFRSLLAEATLPGQLYALCGLFVADPAYFDEKVQAYRNRTDVVESLSGCLLASVPVSQLVECSNSLVIDRSRLQASYNEAVDARVRASREWARRKHARNEPRPGGWCHDILHGSYSAIFAPAVDTSVQEPPR